MSSLSMPGHEGFAALLAIVSGLAAAPDMGQRPEVPPVLVLELSAGGAQAERERRFVQELRLRLDDTEVVVATPPCADFASLTLEAQMTILRRLLETRRAAAVTWLTEGDAGVVVLHFVAAGKGRAVVRLIEASLGPGLEMSLALALKDLLGTARLFDSDPAPGGASRNEPRDETRPAGIDHEKGQEAPEPVAKSPAALALLAPASGPPPESAAAEGERAWRVRVVAVAHGGLHGQIGPSVYGGAGVALERRVSGPVWMRLALDGSAGPALGSADVDVMSWALSSALSVYRVIDLGRLAIAPSVGVGAWWERLRLQAGEGPSSRSSLWRLQGVAALELLWPLRESFVLRGGLGAVVEPTQDVFRRSSDGAIVWRTPSIGWTTTVGVAMPFSSPF